jgi:hypothetical protein
MYTMNDFIEKKIAVSFANREERIEFLKMCQKAGLRWCGGMLPLDGFATGSGLDGHQIECGFGAKRDKDLTHSTAGCHKNEGWKIVPFSEFEREETIGVIKRNGNTITVHMGDLHGTAKCSPDDQFDLYTGCELALRRALKKEDIESPAYPEKFESGKRYKVSIRAYRRSHKVIDPEKPKYYNGKMVCVENGGFNWWTVGKIYEYKDGIVTADDGDKYPKNRKEPYRDAEDAKHPGFLVDERHNSYITMLEIKE